MKKNKKMFLILFLVLFISIGYAFLTSNLALDGLAIIKKSKWDVHFENLVDDNIGSSLNVPAKISDDKLSVDFEVTLNNPGDEYYFYVDVVNNSTFDVMLKDYLVTGLTTKQEGYISTSITYSDEIEINKTNNKYDLLEENTKDTFKILVKYRDDIELTDIPEEEIDFSLTFNTTYEQADENAVERQHNEDVKPPIIKFVANNEVKGNNSWYKSLSVTTKLLDSSPIKSVKYCVTTNDKCTPNTSAEVENNSFTYQLLNNANKQTICIEATDNQDNVCTNCSKEEYNVDGEAPTITALTASIDSEVDNVIHIEVAGEDQLSGLSKYYFSKDAGKTYISSQFPNYTFNGLENGDYIITSYVEDRAGNTSTTSSTSITVRDRSFCEKKGITNLSDCVIATEANTENIEEAKNIIKAKGTPDFNKTSPSIIYEEKTDNTLTEYNTTYYDYYIGTEYSFNQNTGRFILKNFKRIHLDSGNYSQNNYYLCSSPNNYDNCSEIYKIDSAEYTNGSTDFSKTTIGSNILSYNTDEVGMYAADDSGKDSFYYRGSVGSNYIKLGENYYRIIRVNGNGSLRIIYYGTTTSHADAINEKIFNLSIYNPTNVGFMVNNQDFSEDIQITQENNAYYDSTNSEKFYAKSYRYDEDKKLFYLVGTESEGTAKKISWNNGYDNLYKDGFIYTCKLSSLSTGCVYLSQLQATSTKSVVKVKYLYKASTSYENSVANKENSNALNVLNEWYETNIINKELNKFVTDGVFCNDRSFVSGNGYNPNEPTRYSGYQRLEIGKSPTLYCERTGDSFSTSAESGNGKLKYPIGLITADEAVLAGGKFGTVNLLYYLFSSSASYTLTPRYYSPNVPVVWIFLIDSQGAIGGGYVNHDHSLRPVLNIDPTKFTFTGTGTAEDPFVIE